MKRILAFAIALGISSCFINSDAFAFDLFKEIPDKYGIYTSSLEGDDTKLLIADPKREMSYASISPDKTMITFTRFNKTHMLYEKAEETESLLNTEIVIANIDGTDIESIVPPSPYVVNYASVWSDDGKDIYYVSTDDVDTEKTVINRINLESRMVQTISPREFYAVSSPHQVGDKLVYSVEKAKGDIHTIWLQDLNTHKARRVSLPEIPHAIIRYSHKDAITGDFNPKLSPDGTKVAFTRHLGNGRFNMIVRDLDTGKETNYSKQKSVDMVGGWSNDGKQIVYYHGDQDSDRNLGLFIVNYSTGYKQSIPVPEKMFCKTPTFFPDEGSDSDTKLIYSGKKK